MNLLEAFIRDEIFIDFGADVLYGSDIRAKVDEDLIPDKCFKQIH